MKPYQSLEWNKITITHISMSCWADPFGAAGEFDVLTSYEYSPLVIEASILSDEKSVRKSTNQIKKRLDDVVEKKSTKTEVQHFLEKRENFLLKLRSVPTVESFVRFTMEKAEEARKTQEEVRGFLTEIEAIQDLRRELSRFDVRPRFKRRNFLIDAIRGATLSGRKKLKESLVDYIDESNDELQRLVVEGASSETVYTILGADVEFVAIEKKLLRTSQSLAIPLDLSPLRLSLAMLREEQLFEQSRINYPPLFLLFNPAAHAFNLARPYRTIDGHPVFIRAPRFEADKTTAQRETSDARENFEKTVGPLLYGLKGLAGTGETAPSLISEPLVQVILSYLSFNPLSKEMLRVADFGCGTGALLKRVITKALDRCPAEERISISALLNDDSQEDPGKRFRRLSLEEPYAGLVDSRAWKGDMRELVLELASLNERFDIAFVNRVLDMYGGYGIFEFDFSPKRTESCSSFYERVQAKEPNVGDVLAFSESTCHEHAWRAIKYIFERQAHKKKEGCYLLPSIDMKMKKNFFDVNGLDTLEALLTVSKLVLVSVFPGNFKALFPEVNSVKDNIFYCEKSSSSSYSIICISKDKGLIEHIKAQCSGFVSSVDFDIVARCSGRLSADKNVQKEM